MKLASNAGEILLGLWALMNILTFVFYWADKSKARRGRWRISEKTLLLMGVFGGAIGAIAGMEIFRHKTKHWYFWAVNVASAVGHVALVFWLHLGGIL